MYRRIFATALIAGLLAGLGITAIQEVTTTPLIRHAEKFETAAPDSPHRHGALERRLSLTREAHGHDTLSPHAHFTGEAQAHETLSPHAHFASEARSHETAAPHLHAAGRARAHDSSSEAGGSYPGSDTAESGTGIGPIFYTAMANVLTAIGFALVLVACFALAGRPVSGREGVLWGIAGFTVASLAPALGLPPEVPGAMAAELGARQGWWLLCAVATASGLWLLVFRRSPPWMIAGLALLVMPHLVGAPQPLELGGSAPPEIAAHFVAASLVTAAVFWTGLGWLAGTFWNRLAPR